ncbi:hypothetical protein LX32DRAFT_81124 [Colletotrichum zoysiae]|uniref:Uncharacterized protein n=1 Tax=Colletotrichum zoysiae TaxID=1216348 RepID=A0AAD9HAR5_9PEZI|nr:hypothetical protein LX32DRAFT_81124 [Colletotrichum zoysiae]
MPNGRQASSSQAPTGTNDAFATTYVSPLATWPETLGSRKSHQPSGTGKWSHKSRQDYLRYLLIRPSHHGRSILLPGTGDDWSTRVERHLTLVMMHASLLASTIKVVKLAQPYVLRCFNIRDTRTLLYSQKRPRPTMDGCENTEKRNRPALAWH